MLWSRLESLYFRKSVPAARQEAYEWIGTARSSCGLDRWKLRGQTLLSIEPVIGGHLYGPDKLHFDSAVAEKSTPATTPKVLESTTATTPAIFFSDWLSSGRQLSSLPLGTSAHQASTVRCLSQGTCANATPWKIFSR